MKDHIKKKLIEIVGPNSYSDRLIDRVAYSYDGSTYSSRPDGAVWVTSAEQISRTFSMTRPKPNTRPNWRRPGMICMPWPVNWAAR